MSKPKYVTLMQLQNALHTSTLEYYKASTVTDSEIFLESIIRLLH